ncbi:MAG TPA: hypothetical protein VN688_10600 [Gemmataceae bacterium]|nr:hypothetical protein [Gemmataceae bacterium]
MPKVDLVAELAQKLLHALEQQRQSDSDYPLSVVRLTALADPQATPEQVVKALAKKPFATKWIIAGKKDPNSPIALAEDVERLAASPMLLEYTLGLVCSADKPLHPPTKAVGKVDKALKPTFKAALDRQIVEQTLPPSVGMLTIKNKPQLYLQRFPPPPPPPPKKKPGEELSAKLVQVLTEQREHGAENYPLPLDRLIEQAGLDTTPAIVKKAFGLEPFRSQAVLALPRLSDGPVALKNDTERLMASPLLWRSLLMMTRKPDNQAVSAADLKKKLSKNLQQHFSDTVNRQLDARVLPDGIGVLFIKKKPLLFLLADINAGSLAIVTPARIIAPPPEPKPAPAAVDIAPLFDTAFARLDHEHGSHNHVSLVALRQAVPVDRTAFDAALQQLRRAGRYSLSAAEGRHGISAEEQDAGIREDGSLLLFVSRREA